MRVWTEDQKQKQREAIRRWAPWNVSTGPRTVRGKAISSQNAYKHGLYSVAGKQLKTWLYHQSLYIRQVESWVKDMTGRKNQNPSNELLSGRFKNPLTFDENRAIPPPHLFNLGTCPPVPTREMVKMRGQPT